MSALAFRNLLEAGDVAGLRRFWAECMPHLPQPKDAAEAEVLMHMARTEAESVEFKYRAWSHRWLCERGMPSRLPDNLKPKAERLYPVNHPGVGISINTRNEYLKPAMIEVRTEMENAVLEAQADGRLEDTAFVTQRMQETRKRTMRALFGR